MDTGGFITLGGFEHSTLPLADGRCFRLLCLQSPVKDLDQVRCTLETHSLDACPPYYALSYTWGSPFAQDASDEAYSRNYSIAINSKAYEVTKNLHDGLLQLRQSHAGSYFWIDAICIWQTNTQERNSQVDLMSEIYGKAAKVLIWLGVSNADTVSVARLITLLASVPEETIQPLEHRAQYVRVGTEKEKEQIPLENLGLPSYESPVWLLLVSFFRRSYFQRVWVMQENALAKGAIVYCGAVTFSAQDLWGASTFLVRTNIGADLTELDLLINPTTTDMGFTGMTAFTIHSFQLMCHADSWSRFLNNFKFFNPRGVHPDVTTLLQLFLFQTQGFRATDPRDHVFALLGIVKRIADIKGLQSLPICADDTKTAPQIFEHVMTSILESSGWLAFLAFVSDRFTQSVTDLPSWVPNFSAKAPTPLMWVTISKDKPRFDAAKVLSSTKVDFRIESSQLRRYLDVVSDVGEKASDIAKLGVLEEIAKLILKCPANYKIGQDRIEVLWRTLISDQTPLKYPAPATLVQSFSAWVEFTLMKALNSMMMEGQDVGEYVCARLSIEYLAQTDQTGILSGYQQVLDEIVANADHTAVDGTEAYRYMLQSRMLPYASVFSKVAAGRRLFRTESGWLGLGPQSLQGGESIWILAAAPTPFALRKAVNRGDNAYELVGETYVHGAMHGEALGSGEPQWDQIVLH